MKSRTQVPVNKLINFRFGGALGDQPNRVYLTVFLFKQLGLSPGLTVTLKIGQKFWPAVIGQVHSHSAVKESVVFISPDLCTQCQINTGTALTLKFNYLENILTIGPLIGLFTVRNILPDATFGSQEPSLLALANSSENLSGLVFVFCPEDIDWDMSLITGYIPDLDQVQEPSDSPADNQNPLEFSGWKPVKVPLPDVIYDRLPSRTIEARPEVAEAKSRLMAPTDTLYFNPMFLDKWETHVILSAPDETGQTGEVANYLPPTRLVETPADIYEFLVLHRSVFLKPSAGSLGRRIIKISLGERGCFNYMYRSRDKNTIEGSTADFRALINLLRPIMGKRSYIVQKDLTLAKFEGCPFDIRVLAQKDMQGNWRRTKIYVRKAAPDSFLSNLSDGARPKSISEVLKEVFDADFQASYGLGEDIRRAVREIPPALEKGTGRIWGELGIDLGIDHFGKIWLIEINSKPFRALVSESGSFKIIRRSLMRPLEYSKFLAGFYRHSPVKPYLAQSQPSGPIYPLAPKSQKEAASMEIGPILGILSIPRATANLFLGGQSESFTEIVTVAERMNCVAFVFSPFDIDWTKGAVWGYRFNNEHEPGVWERHLYPLPSVIYNRIPNRTMEKRDTVSDAIEPLRKKYGSRLFNPCFLDKWQTHTILCSNRETKEFLPDTRRLSQVNTLADMLSHHKSVYLKPTANSLGNEMIKVINRGRNSYYFIHQTLNNQRRVGLASSFQKLLLELPSTTNGTSEYLVQQAITLAECEGRPFDLRLLVQKNRRGRWQKTGIAARIAGSGSITTHVFYGGTRDSAREAIKTAAAKHGFSIKKVEKQIKNLVSVFPKTIEDSVGQSFGELEMDLGIDRYGKVWFFEANSKPFRFDEKLIRAKSLVRLIHYTKYLDAQEFNSPAD